MPRSPSGASATPSPRVSIKSLELNALHTSQIQDMVHLNGNRSNAEISPPGGLRQSSVRRLGRVNVVCGESCGQVSERSYLRGQDSQAVSYTHLRAHETVLDLVCRL